MTTRTYISDTGTIVDISYGGHGSDGHYYTATENGYKNAWGTEYTPTLFTTTDIPSTYYPSSPEERRHIEGVAGLVVASFIAYHVVTGIAGFVGDTANNNSSSFENAQRARIAEQFKAAQIEDFKNKGSSLPVYAYGGFSVLNQDPQKPYLFRQAYAITPKCVVENNCSARGSLTIPFSTEGNKNDLRFTYSYNPTYGECVSSTPLHLNNPIAAQTRTVDSTSIIASSSNGFRSAQAVAQLCEAWNKTGIGSCGTIIQTQCHTTWQWITSPTANYVSNDTPCEAIGGEYCLEPGITNNIPALTSALNYDEGKFFGSGIAYSKSGQHLEIITLYANSPADRAGLKKGDMITHIGQTSTSSMSTEDAARSLANTEGTITLKIHRPETRSDFTVAMNREWIRPALADMMSVINLPPIRHEVRREEPVREIPKPTPVVALPAATVTPLTLTVEEYKRSTFPPHAPSDVWYVVKADTLNMREEPNMNARIIASVLKGSCLRVEYGGPLSNGFLPVRIERPGDTPLKGWFSSDHLRPVNEREVGGVCAPRLAQIMP